ncbi:BRcat domain-containing protein [Flexithrix dorotheae]|uniref:BRcat domain-containing protein n=1 Tax=Flexithrix dorotheae TaxID=70993 RepID=UPI00036C1F83|nr:IBR domain-containing protein [Flexithrix dorotheae]
MKKKERIVINIINPSDEILNKIEGMKKLSGFWGSSTGNGSIGEITEYILIDYLEDEKNIRRCQKCKEMIALKSKIYSNSRIKCNTCGFENPEIK